MQFVDGRAIYSATDLNNYLECRHLAHLERTVAEGTLQRPERTLALELIARKGLEHETRYLEKLRTNCDVVEFGESGNSHAAIVRAADETIAAMANTHRETAFIFCHADSSPADETVDPATVDAALSRYVQPRVAFSIVRNDFGHRTGHVIIFPQSELRPHLVRDSDGRYIVPIRGGANNATAARHELDAMYDERLTRMIRILAPGLTVAPKDATGAFFESIGYGQTASPQPQNRQRCNSPLPRSPPQPRLLSQPPLKNRSHRLPRLQKLPEANLRGSKLSNQALTKALQKVKKKTRTQLIFPKVRPLRPNPQPLRRRAVPPNLQLKMHVLLRHFLSRPRLNRFPCGIPASFWY